jgi:phospholipid/cholesterol/gamma-HCH transport system ATP-binding protein
VTAGAQSELVVECRGVAAGYDGTPVVEDIDLSVKRGEIVALLGGSGCGKSTLLRSLIGLLPPLAGELRVLGEPLYGVSAEEIEGVLRRTGVVFQQDALFGAMTVFENVAMPLRELGSRLPEAVIHEMVRMKLAMVGLVGVDERAPATLSGGQRKRVALARASILDPEIIFCDEPSAGLDPVIAAGIDEALLQMRDLFGVTILVVSHELESIRAIADRAVMLGHGRVLGSGTIDELAASADEDIHNFFHRVAADPAAGRETRQSW